MAKGRAFHAEKDRVWKTPFTAYMHGQKEKACLLLFIFIPLVKNKAVARNENDICVCTPKYKERVRLKTDEANRWEKRSSTFPDLSVLRVLPSPLSLVFLKSARDYPNT